MEHRHIMLCLERMQTLFVLVGVRPHDRGSLSVVDMDKALGNAYAAEAHLEGLMHNVHAFEAIGYCDVTGDALIVCAGLCLTQLSGVAGISPAGGYAEREAAYLSERI